MPTGRTEIMVLIAYCSTLQYASYPLNCCKRSSKQTVASDRNVCYLMRSRSIIGPQEEHMAQSVSTVLYRGPWEQTAKHSRTEDQTAETKAEQRPKLNAKLPTGRPNKSPAFVILRKHADFDSSVLLQQEARKSCSLGDSLTYLYPTC